MATIFAHLTTLSIVGYRTSFQEMSDPQAVGAFGPPLSPILSQPLPLNRAVYFPLYERRDASGQAGILPNFGSLYYNRVHVRPIETDVGNVSTTISYQVEVWNAFFSSKLLTSLVEIGTDGINVLNGIAQGGQFGALQSAMYDIEVTPEGPGEIDAEIRWVLGGDYGFHTIIGNRVVLFPFKPASPISEEFSWLTNVLRTYSSEQRIALRKHPRQSWAMKYKQWGEIQSRINSAMWGRNYKPFGLPIWTDVTYIRSSISAGTQTIYLDTRYFDYRTEGLLVLLYRDDLTNETKEISAVYGDRLELVRPLENTFPDGAMAMPVVICQPEGGLVREDIGNDVTVSSIRFRALENLEYVTPAPETYLGYEVLGSWNYRLSGSVNSSILHPVVVVDNQTGPWDVFPYRSEPDEMWDWSWASNSQEERWEVKMFLMRQRGRQKSFWAHSRRKDITLAATVPTSSSEWTVANMGQEYLDVIGDPRHVEVVLKNGNTYRREIIGVTETAEDKQTQILEVSATMPEEVSPEDVDRISYMRLVRFNSDDAEIIHGQGIQSSLTMPIITVPQPTGL